MKKTKQFEFKKIGGWGGKRKGAGRKNRSSTAGHAKRESVKPSTPVHITIRLKKGFKGLRSPRLHRELKTSFGLALKKGLRTLHYSLQNNHLHIIGEGEDTAQVSAGMNSLGARFGRHVREKIGGRGSVFEGRYHMRIIRSARQMRNTLAYVLLNESKHKGFEPEYDEYSSARHFTRWNKLLGKKLTDQLADGRGDPLPDFLSTPRSWLAREGWTRA